MNTDMIIINSLFRAIAVNECEILVGGNQYRFVLSKYTIETIKQIDYSDYFNIIRFPLYVDTHISYPIYITLTEYGKAYLELIKL